MKARISAKDFKRIIDNTKRFVGPEYKGGKLPWIYLKVDVETKTIKATALDGHKVSIEYADITEADESFSCYIKPNIPKITRHDSYVDIEVSKNRIYVQVGESIMGYVQPEGEYYGVEKMVNDLMTEPKGLTIGVNANLLKDALASISDYGDRIPIARIDLRGPKDAIVIRSGERGKRENIKIVLPVNLRCEEY
ncbi:hypothetical protein SAMN05443270_1104 [Lacrimispora sphenoides]|uniref:hypothetical protein n=1 Tax=Lacrimispora sphenoides TaxID=29370 RepID=UPI0008C9826F|nr:hypothetical protein [Lacrimispora sphenoides]SET71894.1 hypothetical protein SAMN05443270_1104 [Lacrimispora sphenoides]